MIGQNIISQKLAWIHVNIHDEHIYGLNTLILYIAG